MDDPVSLSPAERATISFFVALQATRTPAAAQQVTAVANAAVQTAASELLSDRYGAFAAALNEGGAIAFLCSLQRDGLRAKVLADVEKVMSAGPPVAAIYAFLTASLPKATRDALQDEVRERHTVDLEVLDGLALAEALADHEIFWIAEQFLSIPAAMRPAPPETGPDPPDWYVADRDRWRARSRQPAHERAVGRRRRPAPRNLASRGALGPALLARAGASARRGRRAGRGAPARPVRHRRVAASKDGRPVPGRRGRPAPSSAKRSSTRTIRRGCRTRQRCSRMRARLSHSAIRT
jgi:hypothetical protein